VLRDLNKAQQDLADYLSEQAYYAGWMDGLEYVLWRAVVNGPMEYGRLSINGDHINELRRLSEACSGWIIFDAEKEETWISIAHWTTKYSQYFKSTDEHQ